MFPNSNKEYSGYFELEIKKGKEFHPNALKLNAARYSILYIVKAHNLKKLYIPYYICESVVETLKNEEIKIIYYSLNSDFSPNIQSLKKEDFLLYPNYFGTHDNLVNRFIKKYKNVIVDNTQAFYHVPPSYKVAICYSPRKFFGVPDGSYLYTDQFLNISLKKDISWPKMLSLLKRMELNAQEGYEDSLEAEKQITESGMKEMSALTEKILQSIDYDSIAKKRKRNFTFLHSKLEFINEIEIPKHINVPMVYPLLLNSPKLREHLLDKKIYIPCWWKCVLSKVSENSFESYLSKNLLPLPIDQRYNTKDMEYIFELILNFVK